MSSQHTPAWNIRKWLLQHPKPHKLKVHFSDGREPQSVKVSGSWAKLGETVAALAGELIEAYDEHGELVRAVRPEQSLQTSDSPELPEALAGDANALLLTHFANLLHRAYEHSTQVAFDKLVDVQDRTNERAENTERRLERFEANYRQLQQERIEEQRDQLDDMLEEARERAAATGGNPADFLADMIGSFVQGAAAGGGGAAGHASNGKGN